MELICRILNKPHNILGTFYSEEYIFSGQVKPVGNYISSSSIWIHKAYPDITSEHKPLMSRLFRFINVNAKTLLVATCKSNGTTDKEDLSHPSTSNTTCKSKTDAEAFDISFR